MILPSNNKLRKMTKTELVDLLKEYDEFIKTGLFEQAKLEKELENALIRNKNLIGAENLQRWNTHSWRQPWQDSNIA